MTDKNAIFWLNQIKEKYIHGGDESFDQSRKDAIDFGIVSIIGFSSARRIIRSDDFPEYKESDLLDLLDEVEKMNINEMVNDFLEGSITHVVKQE